MTSYYRYLKRIFLNVLSLIEVQWLGPTVTSNTGDKDQALNVRYPRTHFTLIPRARFFVACFVLLCSKL